MHFRRIVIFNIFSSVILSIAYWIMLWTVPLHFTWFALFVFSVFNSLASMGVGKLSIPKGKTKRSLSKARKKKSGYPDEGLFIAACGFLGLVSVPLVFVGYLWYLSTRWGH
jgi:hypothetical protein